MSTIVAYVDVGCVTHAAHTWDEFDAREGAFVDMLRSPVGQAIVAEEPRLLPYDGEP
jgi:hypothetical protein